MKNLKVFKFNLIFGILFIILISSCSNDKDKTSPKEDFATDLITTLRNGNWRITYYFDTDHEETDNFNGYNFTFGAGDFFTVSNGTNDGSGNWGVIDNNSNDNTISDLRFYLDISYPIEFQEISDNWEIIEKSSTVIKLRDVSGGNGGIDYLTFTKN